MHRRLWGRLEWALDSRCRDIGDTYVGIGCRDRGTRVRCEVRLRDIRNIRLRGRVDKLFRLRRWLWYARGIFRDRGMVVTITDVVRGGTGGTNLICGTARAVVVAV